MKIIVIGAGVVGVTSAWYLTQDGHDVTVIEAREGPGLETSFGNAGGLCPGFAGPWAAPGMPLKALRWMFQRNAPLKIKPHFDPAQWVWLAQFIRNCSASQFAVNKNQMQEMAHFSKRCLTKLREETGISFDHNAAGVLQIFCTADELAYGKRSADVLAKRGISHRFLTTAEAMHVEPALALGSIDLKGALHLDTDETGDCHLFCKALAKCAEEKGCDFIYNSRVAQVNTSNGGVSGVELAEKSIDADAVVMATGPWANDLLAPLGVSQPIYPVKGYSMTCEITDFDSAPKSSVMDEHSKVMITRLGTRLRAAGYAEINGFNKSMPQHNLDALRDRVARLFPDAADYDTASYWHGFRPMTPQGPAITKAEKYPNLFLNLGHGSNGWTQACGTGATIAKLIGSPVT